MNRQVVVCGVSGSGKSTIGSLLAGRLGHAFVEGDSLHGEANVDKMARGIPLTDEDRWPWLDRVGQALVDRAPVVVTCSALRRRYRDRLRGFAPAILFINPHLPQAALQRRLAQRAGHFMKPEMLASQVLTFEPFDPDEQVLEVNGALAPEEIVEQILNSLRP
jgi:gluconokinase